MVSQLGVLSIRLTPTPSQDNSVRVFHVQPVRSIPGYFDHVSESSGQDRYMLPTHSSPARRLAAAKLRFWLRRAGKRAEDPVLPQFRVVGIDGTRCFPLRLPGTVSHTCRQKNCAVLVDNSATWVSIYKGLEGKVGQPPPRPTQLLRDIG